MFSLFKNSEKVLKLFENEICVGFFKKCLYIVVQCDIFLGQKT
jgi:hypothetical protein